jgi:hypothetical protein
MKIILDESTPQKLRLLIDSRHTVFTTWFQGWSGLQNGALLKAAEEAEFDLFITADQARVGAPFPQGSIERPGHCRFRARRHRTFWRRC